MDITIGGQPRGSVTIELFNTVTPLTADNFYQLCRGTCTNDPQNPTGGCTNNPGGSLVGSKFHRVIPNFMIQGGDFTRGDGKSITIFLN